MASLNPRPNACQEVNFRSGDMVHILVGKELATNASAGPRAQHFSIDRALWKPSSPQLQRAGDKTLRAGHPTLGTFPPDRFNKYLNYVAYGAIVVASSEQPYSVLADLYYDGEVLIDEKFQQAVVDAAIARFDTPTTFGQPDLPNGAAVMKASGPMRRLYIDMWAKKGTDQGMQAMLSNVVNLLRKPVEAELRSALVRNRDRKIDHYDEEEKHFIKFGVQTEEPRVKRQRTE